MIRACAAGLLVLAFGVTPIRAHADLQRSSIRHILLLSIDGLHPVDVAHFIRTQPDSALAGLTAGSVSYTAATTTLPSDSYPGFLALVTGGSPRTTGILYDEFYDRALSPPAASGSSCATIGTQIRLDKIIEIDPTRVDGGGGIDPRKLPRDPHRNCMQVYPHDALRVNTVFEVIKAAGGRTAWSDKHLSYEIANGPSGTGVDDLFDPEIAAGNVAAAIATTQAYDDVKVVAVLNELRGYDHSGTTRSAVPTILGMNFQAVTTAQVTQGNGYLDAAGTPSPGLAAALAHVDRSIAAMFDALDRQGLRSSTAVIITSKHGQSPIDPTKIRYIAPAVIGEIVDTVAPHLILKQNAGDGVLLWLADQSKTDVVVAALRANAERAGFAEVFSGQQLAALLASPQSDSRAPDILIRTEPGVLYLAPPRIAAHGGMNAEDRSVALIVSVPGKTSEVIEKPVATTQVAPTMLHLLCLDPSSLQAVTLEHTALLPGFP